MMCGTRRHAGNSSLLCLPSPTIRARLCMSAAKRSQSTVTETAAAGGARQQAQTQPRTALQRSASTASGTRTPGATSFGCPTASSPSRSEWRTDMACASRRAQTRMAKNGPLEDSWSRPQTRDTKRAGAIEAVALACGAFVDHALPKFCISRACSLASLSFRAAVVNTCNSRRLYTMSTPPLLLSWASSSRWPFPEKPSSWSTPNPLRIAILDSSFNPPSKAHYAIASYTPHAFDAHLLLLSSKNVDKVPGPGDSSFEDRTAMMEIMAKRMQAEAPEDFANIAVGSLAAATFAEKAPIIQAYLQASPDHPPGQEYTLIFFIGFDTVTRLFMSKYYGDSEANMHKVLEKFFIQDNCQVICAKRPVENVAQKDVADQQEETFFARPEVAKYMEMGKLKVVDVEGTVGISSTKIRNALKQLASPDAEDSEETLKSLVLDDIVKYCKKKGLYSQ